MLGIDLGSREWMFRKVYCFVFGSVVIGFWNLKVGFNILEVRFVDGRNFL